MSFPHRNSESQSVINHTGFSYLSDQKILPRQWCPISLYLSASDYQRHVPTYIAQVSEKYTLFCTKPLRLRVVC